MNRNEACGFYMATTTCFKCGSSYGYNGYSLPGDCPNCKQIKLESKRIYNKVKRKKVKIKRSHR